MANLQEIRKDYRLSRLDIETLDNDPLVQFKYWLNEAIRANVPEVTAMALSTATTDGKPTSRMVLLKQLDHDGFTFFTNYESKKGQQLQLNPFGSLLFFWPQLERQVRIEGKIARCSRRDSDEYFNSRPDGSKIGAWASPQSRRIPNRDYLENLQQDYYNLFRNKPLERPENWGGYKLLPNLMEFWQGRENRLHDRFEYTLNGNLWEIHRLAP
jgi:pyridoxamine 5'-phosphate oxidase